MYSSRIRQSTRPGSTILLAMYAVIMLLILAVATIRVGLDSRLLAIRSASATTAKMAADAGFTKALFEMNQQLEAKTFSANQMPSAANELLEGTGAIVAYEVTLDESGDYVIVATGRSGGAERTVTAVVEFKGPFEAAIMMKGLLDIKMGAVIDWYNYDGDDKLFAVGTNSTKKNTIDLKKGVTVKGDLVVGVGGGPDVIIIDKKDVSILGETYALSEPYYFPSVVVPSFLEALPSSGTLKGGVTITQSARYEKIDIKGGKKKAEVLTIDGPVNLYITGDFTVGNSAGIQINTANPEAYVNVYVDGKVDFKNGSEINNQGKSAKDLKIYGLNNCKDIDLKNTSNFYGAVYAPDAKVTVHNSAEFYGPIVAKEFEQKSKGDFFYDAALRETEEDDAAVHFTVKRWRED